MTTFIIPGIYGSKANHWQSWIEPQLDDSIRIHQPYWDVPCLKTWSDTIGKALEQSPHPVWIIAHGFGCLATAAAAQSYATHIAGALFVAPADPARFSINHFRLSDNHGEEAESLLPDTSLSFPSIIVASENDSWVRLNVAAHWATTWGSRFMNAGFSGHINAHSGFGPWPWGLDLYEHFRASHEALDYDRNLLIETEMPEAKPIERITTIPLTRHPLHSIYSPHLTTLH